MELLQVSSAALMLADPGGQPRLMASSSEEARLLELQHQGPCLECFATARPVLAPDLVEHRRRWPGFVAEAQKHAVSGAYALPMRLRADTIGSMNLFCKGNTLTPGALDIAQGLADVATIALISYRLLENHSLLSIELQEALNSRIAIEQAKGVVAASGNLDMGAAFIVLRRYARSRHHTLSQVAEAVASGRLDPRAVLEQPEVKGRRTRGSGRT